MGSAGHPAGGTAHEASSGRVVNDWQLSGVLTAGSGAPYTVGFSYRRRGGQRQQNLTGSPSYAPRILMWWRSWLRLLGQPVPAVQHGGVPGPWLGDQQPRPRVGRRTTCADALTRRSTSRSPAISGLGGSRTLQLRVEVFNAFNSVVITTDETRRCKVTSPINRDAEQPALRHVAVIWCRAPPAAERGVRRRERRQAMRSMQAQIRF